MAAFDLFVLQGGKQKRIPSQSNTLDFLAVRIGASNLTITEATGHFDFSAKRLTNLADPVGAQDAATKAYADAISGGLDPKDSVDLVTVAALAASTYDNGASGVGATLTADANGALTIDGTAATTGMRVLIKDQAAGLQNGIYDVSDPGGAGAPFVLTRSLDFNGAPAGEVTKGARTAVISGATKAGWVYYLSTVTAITLGSTALTFSVLDSTPTGTAASGGGVQGKLSVDSDLGLGVTAGVVRAKVSGEGVDFSGGNIALKLDGSTLSQSASGAKVADAGITGTQLAGSVAGAGLAGGAGSALSVNVDGSSIEIATDTLQVKDAGITAAKIAAAVAGAGLAGGAGSALSVNVDGSSIEIATDTLQVKDAGITAAKIAAAVAGAGLAGGAGSALSVNTGDGTKIASDAVVRDDAETFTNDNAGTITVRQAVYIKSNGAADLALASVSVGPGTRFGLVEDATILTTASGKITSRVGAKVGGFTGLTIGAPVYVSRATAGAYQQDLSGFVAGEHVISLGEAISATTILYNPRYLFEY